MKRLYRSKSESVIAGICGGIGLTYNIDPTIVRLATVALAIITGLTGFFIVMILYLVAWAVIPLSPT